VLGRIEIIQQHQSSSRSDIDHLGGQAKVRSIRARPLDRRARLEQLNLLGRSLRTNKRLGERKIIEIIQSHLDSMPKMPIPFGDDVSACDIGNDMLAVLKTDMLVDRTDVPPEMTLWQAARKSVVMNVSDFAAKGVRPLAILASVGLPGNLARNDIDQIGKGLNSGAREYKTFIIGGDTNEASDIVISLSLFGTTRKGQLMLRSGAKPGDLIAVTGPFGKAAAGLKILVDGLQVSKKSRRSLLEPVLCKH